MTNKSSKTRMMAMGLLLALGLLAMPLASWAAARGRGLYPERRPPGAGLHPEPVPGQGGVD